MSTRHFQTSPRESVLRLAHRARKNPADRDVLHDALLEYVPRYGKAVEGAHDLARQLQADSYPGTAYVFFLPRNLIAGRLASAFKVVPAWEVLSFGRYPVPVWHPPSSVTSRNVILNSLEWRSGVLTYVAREHART